MKSETEPRPEPALLRRLRRLVQALLLIGLVGTAIELALIDHFEDAWQFVPFGSIALSVGALAWTLISQRAASVWACRLAMALMIAAGVAGAGLHYKGSREFQIESDPSTGGFELFMKVMRAQAPPVLAPGYLTLFGLLGIASVYRTPVTATCIHEKTIGGPP